LSYLGESYAPGIDRGILLGYLERDALEKIKAGKAIKALPAAITHGFTYRMIIRHTGFHRKLPFFGA
jgi:hypothetical protein